MERYFQIFSKKNKKKYNLVFCYFNPPFNSAVKSNIAMDFWN